MRFEKISLEQFTKDYKRLDEFEYVPHSIQQAYDNIKLPRQGTEKSMGMDFFAPYEFCIPHRQSITVMTGVRWKVNDIDSNVGMLIFPRSGMGFKYGVRLSNTVGVIDADYCNADNEGHILIRMYNPSWDDIVIRCGEAFAQGIILPYIICDGAESDSIRIGGFGSTTRKE